MFEEITEALKSKTALVPQTVGEGKPFITLKNDDGGQDVKDLEHLLEAPINTRGKATLDDLESFIQYVKERKTAASRIFVSLSGAEFVCVLNFHSDKPSWCDDIAFFNSAKKAEWKTWLERNNSNISQVNFADFVEDNIHNIVEPSGATLLEVAKNLSAKKTVNFKSGVNLENGDIALHYEETTQSKAGEKGSLNVPSEIKLALQPFEGAPSYSVSARLRYRIDDGKLCFTYKLRQIEKVWEDAVKDAVTKVGTETEVPILLGRYTQG